MVRPFGNPKLSMISPAETPRTPVMTINAGQNHPKIEYTIF